MTNTTYCNFNSVEGTDIVNPLVQSNPNWTSLDTILNTVNTKTLTTATHVKSGTVHAVTRTRLTNNMLYPSAFRFTATADWETGDSMVVNSVSVTVKLPNGETPETGSFVAGTSVIGILDSGVVTLLTTPNKAAVTASEVTMTSGDSVQDAIDKIGSVIRVVEGGSYAAGDTWAIPSAAQDLIDSGKHFLVEASFYYGDTVSSARLTKVTTRGFGRHIALTLNRSDIQTGLVNISASSFTAYGFDIAHAPKLYDLYLFPIAAY